MVSTFRRNWPAKKPLIDMILLRDTSDGIMQWNKLKLFENILVAVKLTIYYIMVSNFTHPGLDM